MNEYDFVWQILSVYGPLALGWPIAGYMFIKFNGVQSKLTDYLIADTEAKMQLANAVQSLEKVIILAVKK